MICLPCRKAAKMWRVGVCTTEGFPHSSGELITECERVVRHEIEQAGGVGQLLVATKDAHQNQEVNRGLLYHVNQLHGPEYCPGGTWCDCQHHCLSNTGAIE